MKKGFKEGKRLYVYQQIEEPSSTVAEIASEKSTLTDISEGSGSDRSTVSTVAFEVDESSDESDYDFADSIRRRAERQAIRDAAREFALEEEGGLTEVGLMVHDYESDFGRRPFSERPARPTTAPTKEQKKEKFITEWLGGLKKENER